MNFLTFNCLKVVSHDTIKCLIKIDSKTISSHYAEKGNGGDRKRAGRHSQNNYIQTQTISISIRPNTVFDHDSMTTIRRDKFRPSCCYT